MRAVSLCSGYDGLAMAVEEVFGAEVVLHADTDPAASRVLAERWPGVRNVGDITTVDWDNGPYAGVRGRVEMLLSGYPCQPDSLAGKGLSVDDARWIWPDVARAISCLGPRYVFLENVFGHFVRGFRTVLGSLTDLGYDAVWTVVPASDVGAPHLRKRLFVLATANAGREPGDPGQRTLTGGLSGEGQGRGWEAAGPFDVAERPAGTPADSSRERRAGAWDVRADGWGEHPDGGVATADTSCAGLEVGRVEQDGGQRPATERGGGEPAADAASDGRDEGWPESAGELGGSDVAERGVPAAADAVRERFEGHPQLDGQPLTGQDGACGHDLDGRTGADCQRDRDWRTLRNGQWIDYGPAVARWHDLTRCVPQPITTGQRGARVLNSQFVEWMQGLPAGHVTDVEGLSRNDMLRILGNGVVPQQAARALRLLVARRAAIEAVAA